MNQPFSAHAVQRLNWRKNSNQMVVMNGTYLMKSRCEIPALVIYSKILTFLKSHLTPQGPNKGHYMAPCKLFRDYFKRFQG